MCIRFVHNSRPLQRVNELRIELFEFPVKSFRDQKYLAIQAVVTGHLACQTIYIVTELNLTQKRFYTPAQVHSLKQEGFLT